MRCTRQRKIFEFSRFSFFLIFRGRSSSRFSLRLNSSQIQMKFKVSLEISEHHTQQIIQVYLFRYNKSRFMIIPSSSHSSVGFHQWNSTESRNVIVTQPRRHLSSHSGDSHLTNTGTVDVRKSVSMSNEHVLFNLMLIHIHLSNKRGEKFHFFFGVLRSKSKICVFVQNDEEREREEVESKHWSLEKKN